MSQERAYLAQREAVKSLAKVEGPYSEALRAANAALKSSEAAATKARSQQLRAKLEEDKMVSREAKAKSAAKTAEIGMKSSAYKYRLAATIVEAEKNQEQRQASLKEKEKARQAAIKLKKLKKERMEKAEAMSPERKKKAAEKKASAVKEEKKVKALEKHDAAKVALEEELKLDPDAFKALDVDELLEKFKSMGIYPDVDKSDKDAKKKLLEKLVNLLGASRTKRLDKKYGPRVCVRAPKELLCAEKKILYNVKHEDETDPEADYKPFGLTSDMPPHQEQGLLTALMFP